MENKQSSPIIDIETLVQKSLAAEQVQFLANLEGVYQFKALFSIAIPKILAHLGKPEFPMLFSEEAGLLMHEINYRLRKIGATSDEEKRKIETIVITIARWLLFHYKQKIPNLDVLMEEVVVKTAFIHQYDAPKALEQLGVSLIATVGAEQNEVVLTRPIFEWQESAEKLKALTRHCEAKGWIKTATQFTDFVKAKHHEDNSLQWNTKHLNHLLILFHHLYSEKKWLRLSRRKAIWQAFDDRLFDFENNPIQKNFTKIKHRLFDEQERYEETHKEVMRLLKIVDGIV